MSEKMSLVNVKRTKGSLNRRMLDGALIQSLYHYRDITIVKLLNSIQIKDGYLENSGFFESLSKENYQKYVNSVQDVLESNNLLCVGDNEQIYRNVHKLRLEHFSECMDSFYRSSQKSSLHTFSGIDQSQLINEKMKPYESVLISLADFAYAKDCVKDIQMALHSGKHVWCLCSDTFDGMLPEETDYRELLGSDADLVSFQKVGSCYGCMDPADVICDMTFATVIKSGSLFMLGYGEEALSQAHNLSLPSGIKVTPESFYCRALTNIFSRTLPCAIYIPANFSINEWVPITSRTLVSYYHLAELEKRFGEDVYMRTWQNLYSMAPGLFINIYDDHIPAVYDKDLLLDEGQSFQQMRDRILYEKINRGNFINYFQHYISKDTYEPISLSWEVKEPQNAVLINGIYADPKTNVLVVLGDDKQISPRTFWFNGINSLKRGAVCNFSFFMTEMLCNKYNEIREERPQEKLFKKVGHIDYRLINDSESNRYESFPLYNKACLAKRRSGRYCSFSYALGGGKVRIGNEWFSWTNQQVNTLSNDEEIIVYTPMLSVNSIEESDKFSLPVGYKRINTIWIGEKLLCIRDGDVLLPSIGTVISLEGTAAERLKSIIGASDSNGYYTRLNFETEIVLNPPDGFSDDQWEDIEWVYGGGLTLIRDGAAMNEQNHINWCHNEGWMTPLSQQTQESNVHALECHPRTAVGITKDGGLFALVFSGRTPVSAGVNYVEMCTLAKKFFPEIETMINWDGGASSVFGWFEGNQFTELSYPAASDMSCTGMARKINSMLVISSD